MADPSTYRPRPGDIPTSPGVYRFRDGDGRVIYVGKAKSLRSRLSSYFQDISALHPRTRRMVTTGTAVEWTVVSSEVEALQLEYSWIKEFDPPFNVKYRDDKSYPYLAVTMSDEYPRALVMRGAKRRGTRYFGPYTHAWAIRETLDQLLRVFPVRTCSSAVFRRAAASGRPCLLGYIDKCSAPCVGRVDAASHRDLAERLCDFLEGQTGRFVRDLKREMARAANDQEYERAARLRDDIAALERVAERSAVVLPDATDADVFGLASDELEVAVQVFHVRGGRVRGQRGWVIDRDVASMPELVDLLVTQVYGGESPDAVPREVLVPVEPTDAAALAEWLGSLRGAQVSLRVPRRGDKRALQETVARNAAESLARHKLRRAGDLSTRSQALSDLQEALGLVEAPLRIETFDVSHNQGTDVVASMVVFEDGVARKSDYRRFIIRDSAGDDVAAIREVISRRFRHGTAAPADEVSETEGGETEGGEGAMEGAVPGANQAVAAVGRPGRPVARFAYRPQLVVVDGGRPQVESAARALADLGVTVPVVGLAKRLEEVWTPGSDFPVVLPRGSEALYLLQRMRDEAHRFAITFHRQRRSRGMTTSALDGIPGLGETRRRALLDTFGSVARLRAASEDELRGVAGIGPALAATIASRLRGETPSPAVNVTTGEVLQP